MAAPRGEFSSRFGFLMAASGSAVGLGNIWGFPTNAASNGGAAFLIAYLILAFALAYPALMAELIIGRYARSNAVTALRKISAGERSRAAAMLVGFIGIITVSLILSFYAIVSGWMIAFFFDPLARIINFDSASRWLTTDAVLRNSIFVVLFMLVTVIIIRAGVKDGIEKWASRLMPSLIIILILLIIYVLTLPGAMEGLRAYLVPDFSRIVEPALVVDAMGQAFFSLSLGVGTMLIYGSYISKEENLPTIGGLVALLDIGIAVLAGLLILPAMYVALANGVEIFDAEGGLIAGPGLIVSVLPALFNTMGSIGVFVALAFFLLMTIASLTSSISMLEVPVAYGVEHHGLERKNAAIIVGSIITIISLIVVFYFDPLFDMVVTFTTEVSQPLLGFSFCIFVAWIWRRNDILQEIKQGSPEAENGLFWKVWPFYVKYICPLAILVVYFQ
ncbi:sodium-dependent transporter [Gammaproteobacteria bacterium]|uniref:Sodium-dependent transporter n=1 Tax=OM182 bacterium MED-G28 TaxID=1986256 RepID=A0A2A5W8P4_9GAMM|nr:sodium-dependent transporter [Gammaproteobacteria bacterium]PDH32664.1 MAG: sodium-dependent transporter [OM182 bacterium MED-G28]